MFLIAASLALLVIYAGVKLLILVKQKLLGSSYHRTGWFFIIAGSLILICSGIRCIYYMDNKCHTCMMHTEYKMMHNDHNNRISPRE